ncbi:MAG: hypothetical protein KA988_06095 [Longilinea sp.]|nr:hypothetical protein [Longilinea sp.]
MDWIWTIVAFLLTLAVFSYLLGDNPIFRLVMYIFVGVVSGYVAALLCYQVVWGRLIQPVWLGLIQPIMQSRPPTETFAVIPLVMAAFLLAKLSPRLASLGNWVMAVVVGMGAAVAISGAVMGTIFTQFQATLTPFDLQVSGGSGLLEGVIVLVGTVTSLAYFHFGARIQPGKAAQRHFLIEGMARVGQFFIGITLGALFVGVFSAALTALIERLIFLWISISTLF